MIEALTWQSMMYVFFVIVFMILQWVMEAIRWRVLTKGLLTIDLFSALKMIFTGLSFSMITPNRSGEFIGRVVHIPSEKRIVASAVTIYGSAIQWVVYCLFGTISLYLIDLNHFENQKDALLKTTLGFLKLISPLIALGGFCIVLCVG